MRPEHELLLKSARAAIEEKPPAGVRRLIEKGVDAGALVEAARHHGVTALLYKGLYAAPEAVPEGLMNTLRAAFHAGAVRSRLHLRELIALAEAFAAEGVPLIPLKGPALAAEAYGDVALRAAGDLDVLVPHAEVPRARRLLLARGYTTHIARADEEAKHLRTQLGYEFAKGSLCVEVHWAFLPRTLAFRLDPEQAWRRAVTTEIEGVSMQTLSFEDRMLFLCAHGAKHGWDRLKWICDVAALLRPCTDADARRLLRHAVLLQSRRPLLLGCALAEELLGASLPPALAEAVRRDRAVPKLSAHVRRHLFKESAREDEAHHRAFFLLATRERWRDRLPYAAHLVRLAVTPTARDRAFLPLPRRLGALYYLVRPLRLAADWLRALIR